MRSQTGHGAILLSPEQEVLSLLRIWMELENAVLDEIRQTLKDRAQMHVKSERAEFIETEERMVVVKG